MRAIPFRVVCLLGMNDGDYPRRQTPADFDLMAQPGHSRPGDRSRREDDRYLFLEALLSARDALHISWVGLSARDNSVLPPSVLVGQLRDYLAAGWVKGGQSHFSGDGTTGETERVSKSGSDPLLLAALTVDYPLQPFSRRYFGGGDDPRVFTYAREWQQAHRGEAPAASTAVLEPWQPDIALGLGQLQRFLAKPVAYFFNQRLKVYFNDADDEAIDDEPFALDGLQRYSANHAVLHAAIDAVADLDHSIDNATRRLHDEGRLPPGGFGSALQIEIATQARALASAWQAACQHWSLTGDKHELRYISTRAPTAGWQVDDWLTDLRCDSEGTRQRLELVSGTLRDGKALRYDKLIPAWVTHLLGNACGLLMQTRLIGIDAQPTLQALAPDEAADMLDQLLATLHAGMRAPLPVARKTAFAWLLAGTDEKKDAATVAARRFDGDDYGHAAGERGEDACLARAWASFADMQAHGFEAWLGPYRALFDNVILTQGDAA